MYLANKTFHPKNFRFAHACEGGVLCVGRHRLALQAWSTPDDVYRLRVEHPRSGVREETLVPPHLPEHRLDYDPERMGGRLPGARTVLGVTDRGELALHGPDDRLLLRGRFALSGPAWLFQFDQFESMRFFGLGEKSGGLEKSNAVYRFWNLDVWADIPMCEVERNTHDPEYISIPYLVIQQGETYLGLLIDNPYPAAIGLSPRTTIANQLDAADSTAKHLFLGAEDGLPSLYVLYGPTLAELTRKLQKLTGVTPLPPRWALGHHQSRWGYSSCAELEALAHQFEAHEIPNDGLWLDIDYMDGYRVFTFAASCAGDLPGEVRALAARGYHVVPILDPGVKHEPGYEVYDSGRAADVFCKNIEGEDFIGMVWPGWTVFPDFTLPEGRAWWAQWAQGFAALGFDGAWLDMNDPSTGPVDCMGMRFCRGTAAHEVFHNQYAIAMAWATREGFAAALGDRRPFLLSRSGTTGSQRYCAVWTGDNFSSYVHLRGSVPRALNLGLSGMPFAGADVPGFGGDATDELTRDWIKAAFLAPFLRNHAMHGSREQEPWTFGDPTLACYRHYVQLRYRLLPYLYDLFAEHERTGEAIWRPLHYDFPSSFVAPARLVHLEDQFMVGPAILQAPILDAETMDRVVLLPAGDFWDARTGDMLEGAVDRIVDAHVSPLETPLYLRSGAIVPMLQEMPKRPPRDFTALDLLLVPPNGESATFYHHHDDGSTYGYQRGEVTRYALRTTGSADRLTLHIETLVSDYGPVCFTPVTPAHVLALECIQDGVARRLTPQSMPDRWTGDRITLKRWT